MHLSERLAYEAAVRQQRLRTEISQVSRKLHIPHIGLKILRLNIFHSFVSHVTKIVLQVKREAEHFKSSVESGKRKRSRGSKDSAAAAEEVSATVQKPFVFRQKETEAQIRKRKMVEEVDTSASGVEPEVKKKKLKKKKDSDKQAANTEKSKSKKGKKLQQETKSSKGRSKEGGERSALLKSVFSGGGGS